MRQTIREHRKTYHLLTGFEFAVRIMDKKEQFGWGSVKLNRLWINLLTEKLIS